MNLKGDWKCKTRNVKHEIRINQIEGKTCLNYK